MEYKYLCSWWAERKGGKAKGNLRQSATKWSRVQPYDPTKSHACEYEVRCTGYGETLPRRKGISNVITHTHSPLPSINQSNLFNIVLNIHDDFH